MHPSHVPAYPHWMPLFLSFSSEDTESHFILYLITIYSEDTCRTQTGNDSQGAWGAPELARSNLAYLKDAVWHHAEPGAWILEGMQYHQHCAALRLNQHCIQQLSVTSRFGAGEFNASLWLLPPCTVLMCAPDTGNITYKGIYIQVRGDIWRLLLKVLSVVSMTQVFSELKHSVVIPQQLKDTDKCDYVTGKILSLTCWEFWFCSSF